MSAEGSPQTTIVVSLILAGLVLTWRGLQRGTISPRTYASLLVVTLFLLVLGSFEVTAKMAATFAVLVAFAVLVSGANSLPAITALTQKGA